MNPLILSIILTVVPLIELRGGLPLALINAGKYDVPEILVFIAVVLLNILLIFFIFFFLDNLHKFFLNYKSYKKFYEFYLKRMQNRISSFKKKNEKLGILALILFVAVPLPLTGAYSGVFLSWILKMNRKKSIAAISLGVFIAGVLVYFGTKGVISFLGFL